MLNKANLLLIIPLSIIGMLSCKQSGNPNISLNELGIDSNRYINFTVTNNLKSAVRFLTVKKNQSECDLILHTFKKHKPTDNSWQTTLHEYSPENYDSLVIQPGKSNCFYLNTDTKDVDTVLAVTEFYYLKDNHNRNESLYLCFIIKNGKVSEFTPDLETKKVLYSMDKNHPSDY